MGTLFHKSISSIPCVFFFSPYHLQDSALTSLSDRLYLEVKGRKNPFPPSCFGHGVYNSNRNLIKTVTLIWKALISIDPLL